MSSYNFPGFDFGGKIDENIFMWQE